VLAECSEKTEWIIN